LVERCVSRLDGLREIVGSGVLDELAHSVQANRPAAVRSASGAIVPRISEVAGIDSYAVLLPKRDVTADFVEGVSRNGRLVVAIGDAPMHGLKSAFVARFIGSMFRSLVSSAGAPHVDQILNQVSATISRHRYFERVSMQCVEVMLDRALLTLASAGHPYPVVYSARYNRCDRLPVHGSLLYAEYPGTSEAPPYRVRHADMESGDVIVLVSDGIVDGGRVDDPYGYRFIDVIERHVHDSARRICEAIIDSWRNHLDDRPAADDATIVVLKVTGETGKKQDDENR
jgi:serine phosphatase RsbU (regulator of sigma subunit)